MFSSEGEEVIKKIKKAREELDKIEDKLDRGDIDALVKLGLDVYSKAAEVAARPETPSPKENKEAEKKEKEDKQDEDLNPMFV